MDFSTEHVSIESIEWTPDIERMYADSRKHRDGPRCLSSLTRCWIGATDLQNALELIGAYGRFHPGDAHGILRLVEHNDYLLPRFAVGREGSPVVYIEALPKAEAEMDIDRHSVSDYFSHGRPDEADFVPASHVGQARKYTNMGKSTVHRICEHDKDDPPVPAEEYAPVSEDRVYVRLWWD